MGRQRIIDREKVLEAAEEIVINQGATALTIDAVAKAMGISKGGVQYCFGNKDALIDAMFERWGQSYDEIFNQTIEQDNSPEGKIFAHMQATHQHDKVSMAKGAFMLRYMGFMEIDDNEWQSIFSDLENLLKG
ncbi:TetR/AcrR family transcriptional regulator [Providencia rettgeri]|uniref:TetR/AcrR family transcriptional regulator n=1 Tax=Providencia rettgeri TaxID=587 RepID=UPI001CFD2B98|nr:TetR/AcrR family transcriptional regulator [Providencia rettgeri]MCB4856264.1 TetR/AcrR family transcriptional regulator [Providencia rettgeri]MCD6315920.1 TetR/AcrR family transcriptional regulator [Providencia rettgeri]